MNKCTCDFCEGARQATERATEVLGVHGARHKQMLIAGDFTLVIADGYLTIVSSQGVVCGAEFIQHHVLF